MRAMCGLVALAAALGGLAVAFAPGMASVGTAMILAGLVVAVVGMGGEE